MQCAAMDHLWAGCNAVRQWQLDCLDAPRSFRSGAVSLIAEYDVNVGTEVFTRAAAARPATQPPLDSSTALQARACPPVGGAARMPSVFASQPTGTPASLTVCSPGGSGHGPGSVTGDGSGTGAGADGTPSQQS